MEMMKLRRNSISTIMEKVGSFTTKNDQRIDLKLYSQQDIGC